MKITLPATDFVFTPSTNTIDFSPMLGSFLPYRLLAVTNITTGKLIYAVASSSAGFSGSFSTTTYTNDTLTYVSSNAGQSASDIIEVLYDSELTPQLVAGVVKVQDGNGLNIGSAPDPLTGDNRLFTQSSVQAGDGTPILSTYDTQSGEDGLNVNLLNSSFGGQLGSALPIPNNNNALSVGFLNGSVLSAPRMDPVTNELIVQSSPVAMQDVNIAQVNGNAFAGANVPVSVDGFGGSGVLLGQNTRGNSIPVVLASNQTPVPITATSPIEVIETVTNIDVLGADIIGQRNNQIELNFSTVPASGITISTSGGASATASNGHTIFATGTTAGAAAVSGTTTLTTSYRAGHEVYCMFTAAFLNLLSNVVAIGQIGLLDSGANNGFTVGIFNGLFGIVSYFNATPTLIYSNNFNTDLLNGGATSKFTRDGTPEAIDLTKSNLFRIRFAWLGSGNIYFEVFSPDGKWVLFHNIRQPNSSYNPSLTTPDLPMRVQVTKGSGTTNASIASACWSAGTTSDVGPLSSTITDATQAKMVRAVIEGKTTGGGGGYVPVKVNPSGALAVEATLSGTSAMNISQYGGTSTTLGQKVSASSIPVVVSSDQSNLNTFLPDQIISGAPTTTLGNNLLLSSAGSGSLSVDGYKSASVQVVSTGASGNYIFEGSNDSTNWQAVPAFNLALAAPPPILTAITASISSIIYIVPIRFRFFRLRIGGALGAAATAITRLSQEAFVPPVNTVVQATAASLNATVAGTVTVTQPTAASLNVTAAGVTLGNTQSVDIASAAITTSQTSASLTLANVQSISVAVFVTAISGANAAMDVILQQSHDGTNFYDWYMFERITATGQYYSPPLRITGQQYRIVRTVSGTTPSITNSVLRLSKATTCADYKRFFDRTIAPNTLNSTTPSFIVEGCDRLQLVVSSAAGATVNPVIRLQGSEDNSSGNWYDIPNMSITATPSTTLVVDSAANEAMPKFVRAIVGTAGTGAVLNYVSLKGTSSG